MADIKELGESLLADQRSRNDKLRKRQKKEAYKLALIQGGVSLLNNGLKKKTQEFLSNEQVMAAKVKQAQGVDDANFFLRQKDAVDNSGLSALDYFTNQTLPQARAIANERVREGHLDPDSYSQYLREQVQMMAQGQVDIYQQGVQASQGITSTEDFAAFADLRSGRLRSGFDQVRGMVSGLFGGRSNREIQEENIRAVAESDMVTRAETVTSLRNSFSKTGDMGLSLKVAEAVESGEIRLLDTPPFTEFMAFREVEGGHGRKRTIAVYKKINPATGQMLTNVNGEPITVEVEIGADSGTPQNSNSDFEPRHRGSHTSTGPDGNTIRYDIYDLFGSDGRMAVDSNGVPMTMTRETNLQNSPNPDPDEYAQILDSLSEGQILAQADQTQAMLASATEEERRTYDAYLEQRYGGEIDGVSETKLNNARVAAISEVMRRDHGLAPEDSQRLSARIQFNRIMEAKTKDPGFFTGETQFDFTRTNFSVTPDSLEMVRAVGDLEGTPFGVTIDREKLGSMVGTLASDLAGIDEAGQKQFIQEMLDNVDNKYFFMYESNSLGETPMGVLLGREFDDPSIIPQFEDTPPDTRPEGMRPNHPPLRDDMGFITLESAPIVRNENVPSNPGRGAGQPKLPSGTRRDSQGFIISDSAPIVRDDSPTSSGTTRDDEGFVNSEAAPVVTQDTKVGTSSGEQGSARQVAAEHSPEVKLKEEIKSDLKKHEGLRLDTYTDTTGNLTVGYGHNTFGEDMGEITRERAEELLDQDIDTAIQDIERQNYDFWPNLSPNRKKAVINMVFNLGVRGFNEFKKARTALSEGDYKAAAAEILDSRYAEQVGRRANQVADMIRKG